MLSIKISRKLFHSILITSGMLGLAILIGEIILRLDYIRHILPTPTLSRVAMYPELDVKWARLEEYAKDHDVTCFILGSSMAESNIDGDILADSLEKNNGIELSCFNFGLTGFKLESTASLATVLERRFHPKYLIIGVSAVDFDPNSDDTRNLSSIPWFQTMQGAFSVDGWLSENSMIYRYLSLLPKLRDNDYRDELKKSETSIGPNGFRVNLGNRGLTGNGNSVRLKEYFLNPYDLEALDKILAYQENVEKVFVIEMPVMAEFLPHYVDGGEAGYSEKFLYPLKLHLEQKEIMFLDTQKEMSGLIPPEFWYNENHLNVEGANLFSRWLADKLRATVMGGE